MQQLEEMIDKYQNLIFSICYKVTGNYLESQDLTQETFLSAYTHLSDFDGNNEKAWLSKIATNKSLDYLKKSNRSILAAEDTMFDKMESKEPTPETKVLERDVRERLKNYCRQLSPPYDKIAEYYFYQELEVWEISSLLERSEKTIWTQIYRAKAKLKKIYRKEGHLDVTR
ncbi:MAG: sigma-70 family RNA polymerase sigma factor [Hespellia sp.]|nr:sigma-70 family RNA polymerase sigma factor [Hespellia sp.]